MLNKKTEELNLKLRELEPLVKELKGVECPQKRLSILGGQAGEDLIARALTLSGAAPLLPMVSLDKLREVDSFYREMGGLLGYYCEVLRHLIPSQSQLPPLTLSRPPGYQLDEIQAVEEGIAALPQMAEMYPIGGLATRLDFRSPTGASLPAALLPFGGRSLLEGLIRDVEGREELYYRLNGQKVTIPIALMLSDENEVEVKELIERCQWFGRAPEMIRLFKQPSVPVITEEGEWVLEAPTSLALQPGGHGAIWQAALQQGVLDWFQAMGKHHLLIRQINNPLAGLDHALLSLVGLGKRHGKTFGFLSCERDPKVSEGVLALIEEKGKYRIGNIEYTQVKSYGVEEATHLTANTNIIYVNLDKLVPVLKQRPMSGFLLNMKQEVGVVSGGAEERVVLGGRLESMMQSVSDLLVSDGVDQLPTFLAYQKRMRTIASTKRKFTGALPETPEGAYYQLLLNHYELLKQCGFDLPPLCPADEYLERGPTLIFQYHPRLGPLYSVIAGKLRGGKMGRGSELILEPADVFIEHLDLKGSLLIEGTGKCVLKQVSVINKGVPEGQQGYWRFDYERKEGLTLIVHEGGEFHVEGVELKGNQLYEVPRGERWILTSRGLVKKQLDRPTWQWRYRYTEQREVCCLLKS